LHGESFGKRLQFFRTYCASPAAPLGDFCTESLLEKDFDFFALVVLIRLHPCWNLLSAARGSNGGSSDVSRVLAQDGNSYVNLVSHGHCARVFIGVWVPSVLG
jgi:hypothetical protein